MTKFIFPFVILMAFALPSFAQAHLVLDCVRTEKDYVEHYEIKVVAGSKDAKAKVFLDGRDLDRVDEGGRQWVKGVVISETTVLIAIEALFDPEVLHGISYPVGKVSTQITMNRSNGKLIKVEAIQGGILGAQLGNGTRMSEEVCKVR